MSLIVAPPHILAVRFSAIGDILLTTPLLRAIRRRHPYARLTVLTKRQYFPLVADNPHVDEVIGLPPDQPLHRLAALLRERRFSHLLDLHGSLRTRALRALVPGRWSGYDKHRIARTLLIRTKRNFYPEHVPVAERYFDAARGLDVRPDGQPPEFALGADAVRRAEEWLERNGVAGGRPFVACAPGAAHATKRWPADYWLKLAKRIADTGADVVIVGGADDSAVATELAARGGARVISAAGALGLQETGAVIRRAAALISGDTGPMHMATGVGTPVVALFGPTVRAFGFFPYNAHSKVLERDLACRPCSSMGGPVCPMEDHACLRGILPETVFGALSKVLA